MLVGLALVGLSLLLAGLSRREARAHRESAGSGARRGRSSVPAVALDLGLPDRIRRAGREEDLTPRSLVVAKALSAATGVCFGLILGPVAPPRLDLLLVPACGALGFFAPDISLERSARRRHRRMLAALPDALDLLAVSVASGRSLGQALVEIGGRGRGPLGRELAVTGEQINWGRGQAAALESLKGRVGGQEVASLCATLERSRRLGSPLADQLRRRASTYRQQQRREIDERAARAAPKIQLVIALILVPSVLMLMVAALVANGDELLGVAYASVPGDR